MQTLNYGRLPPQRVKELAKQGKMHLDFCAKLYRIQVEQGLYFLHEHKLRAKSWKLPVIEQLQRDYRVKTVIGDMCQFGMTQNDDNGDPIAVKKPSKFITNSPVIAARLSKRCTRDHRHIAAFGATGAEEIVTACTLTQRGSLSPA